MGAQSTKKIRIKGGRVVKKKKEKEIINSFN